MSYWFELEREIKELKEKLIIAEDLARLEIALQRIKAAGYGYHSMSSEDEIVVFKYTTSPDGPIFPDIFFQGETLAIAAENAADYCEGKDLPTKGTILPTRINHTVKAAVNTPA